MRKLYALVLAAGLTVGAPWAITNALFTDTASVGSNTFTTGTVDVSTSPASAVVTYSGMAPGDTTTQSIAVSNGGTLAQRYAVTASATNADTKALKDQLVMTVKTIDATLPATPCDNFDGTQLYSGDLDGGTTGVVFGDTTAGTQAGDRTLAASGSETLCIKVALPSATGNTYQNAATTATFEFVAEQTANNA